MKVETVKALVALRAQAEAMALSIDALVSGEEAAEPCAHERIMDHSAMGQPPRTFFYCLDCKQEIGGNDK